MAINIERLDDEINQIVNRHKKFKLKKLKMKRYKYKNKRPQTSVASVPTLALSKSTVIFSDKKESQKQQQHKVEILLYSHDMTPLCSGSHYC